MSNRERDGAQQTHLSALVALGSGVSIGVLWGFDFIFALVLITLGATHIIWTNRRAVNAYGKR